MNQLSANTKKSADWTVEDCVCPLCRSDQAESTGYDQLPFRVKRCSNCRLWYLSPRLSAEEAQRLYVSDAYFRSGDDGAGYSNYIAQERSLRGTFRKLLETLDSKGATGGALLEVGCGPGYLLDEAERYFTSRAGVEFSALARKDAAERTGAKIYASVDEIEEAQAFDCIVATHVIEHVYDPVPFVESLARRLRPDGKIVLAAPHMGSLARRVLGRHWPSFKYPEHVSFYDENTLPELLRRAGLKVAGRLPYPHVFPLSLVLSKFGIQAPCWMEEIDVTLPGTTISFMASHGRDE